MSNGNEPNDFEAIDPVTAEEMFRDEKLRGEESAPTKVPPSQQSKWALTRAEKIGAGLVAVGGFLFLNAMATITNRIIGDALPEVVGGQVARAMNDAHVKGINFCEVQRNTAAFNKFREGTRPEMFRNAGVKDASNMTCELIGGPTDSKHVMGGHIAVHTGWRRIPLYVKLVEPDNGTSDIVVSATPILLNVGWGDGSWALPGFVTQNVKVPLKTPAELLDEEVISSQQ